MNSRYLAAVEIFGQKMNLDCLLTYLVVSLGHSPNNLGRHSMNCPWMSKILLSMRLSQLNAMLIILTKLLLVLYLKINNFILFIYLFFFFLLILVYIILISLYIFLFLAMNSMHKSLTKHNHASWFYSC